MPDIKKFAIDSTEFLAMLAHDMKTPIKAQIRAMNLLYSGVYGEFSPETKNLILNIIASNKYLECLVDSVLSEYRMKKSDFRLNIQKNDLRKTLEEALCNIGILSEVKEQKVKVNYLTNNFLKEYDEIEIERVVLNLLSNAFEHSAENTEIVITVEDEHGGLVFQIESEGRIIPHNIEHLDRLSAGSGLGLSICKKIIKAHGGKIENTVLADGRYVARFVLP